jgi:uncharacterized membrane protein (UPF0127 family)
LRFLLACLVLGGAGCAADTGTSVANSAPTSAADAPKSATPPSDKPIADHSKPADSDQKKSGDNPNRINQLSSLKTVPITAAHQTVTAWIMDNESKREEGMMFLTDKDVKENQGMIFVFPAVQTAKEHSFWMHNCPMGLDIIYIDKNHHVINSGDGAPENDSPVAALKDYYYVLEVKRGWSKRHGLKNGDLAGIPNSLKTTE